MANVIAIHIDTNGEFKYNLNAGYMISFIKDNGHQGEFFLGNSSDSIEESAQTVCKLKADVIIFTMAKYNFLISLKLAQEIKKIKSNAFIFLGGFFAAGNSNFIIKNYSFIDGVFLSEGELTLLKLLDNIKDNKENIFEDVNFISFFDKEKNVIKHIFNEEEQIDLTRIPSPYKEIIDPAKMNEQYGCIYISSSRGCKYACTYCYHPLLRKKIRHFNISQIIDEIITIASCFDKSQSVLLDFWDDFFISDRDYTINLCKEIIKSKSNFACEVKIKIDTRIDHLDQELLQYLKDANFYFIGFGLESVSVKTLLEMNKLGLDKTEQDCFEFIQKFKTILPMCKKLNIKTGLYIIHGWKGESLHSAKETLSFAESLEPNEIHQNQLTYYKGTKIYPQNYENDFYLYYYKNPKLYTFNLDKIPDSKLDPFIEHYKANHKLLIITGIQDSQVEVKNQNKFQNIIYECNNKKDYQKIIDSEYLYNNIKLNTTISFLNRNAKTLYIQTSPTYEIPFKVVDKQTVFPKITFGECMQLNDKWHKLKRKSFYFTKETSFFKFNIKKANYYIKNIMSGKMNILPMDFCSVCQKCAAENNYRIFIKPDGTIWTCKNGIQLGDKNTNAAQVKKNYDLIKENNISKYDCNNCKIKDSCSKCPTLLNKYGKKYCTYMQKVNKNSIQKYVPYMKKRFYFEKPDSTQEYFLEKSDN